MDKSKQQHCYSIIWFTGINNFSYLKKNISSADIMFNHGQFPNFVYWLFVL